MTYQAGKTSAAPEESQTKTTLLSMSDELPKQLFINNIYVESKSKNKHAVYNPADGLLVADDVPTAGQEDVDAAVSAAEAAFPAWKKSPHMTRRNILLKLADMLVENSEALSHLTRITLGQPVSQGWEPHYAAEILRYCAGWIDKVRGESMPADDGFVSLSRTSSPFLNPHNDGCHPCR